MNGSQVCTILTLNKCLHHIQVIVSLTIQGSYKYMQQLYGALGRATVIDCHKQLVEENHSKYVLTVETNTPTHSAYTSLQL